MIRKMARRAMNKFGKSPEQTPHLIINHEPVSVVIPEKQDIRSYLYSDIQALNYFGILEVRVIDKLFTELTDEQSKIDNAKIIIEFFSRFPEKARLISSSSYYLSLMADSIVFQLIYVTSNYYLERASWCVTTARNLSEIWPNSLTAIIFARVLRESEGIEAERAVLEKAYTDSNDLVVFYNLITNLIDSDLVDEANAAIAKVRPQVENDLAEEISAVEINQVTLDEAIKNGAFAPEGDDDIYTDEMCRNAWLSYYESFVTRTEYFHGDRLLLNNFLRWISSSHNDIDVVLDFGALCAQPLYEAALMAPHIQFVGTDRQSFVAEMNSIAYPLSNLKFDHGDIFEVMEKVGALPGRKALVHIRTACTLYPAFIEKLYSTARELGFTHIYLIENAGMVRSRLEFIKFQSMNEKALVTKHRMNLHNYREQLGNAGYTINNFSRVCAPGLWRGDHAANYLGSQYEIHAVCD
jgi:hypothetical protein